MIEPYKGRVYDPCCGSSGMFVSERRVHPPTRRSEWRHLDLRAGVEPDDVEAREDEPGDPRDRGQSRPPPRRHFSQRPAPRPQGGFHPGEPGLQHERLGGDRLRDDVRWKYGVPPVGNANFAWVEHMIHHLAPGGIAGFVLANFDHDRPIRVITMLRSS